MYGWFPDFRTAEEKAADHQKWIDKHYLQDGKDYTFELSKLWQRGWSPTKTMSWHVYIKEAFCPWMIVALEVFEYPEWVPGASFVAKARAKKWARDYLKRGGPPGGFFAPPAPDPNIVTYHQSA